MASGLPGYVPLVLDPTIQSDGFGAQILEIVQVDQEILPAVFIPVPRLFEPNPSRKGKNQIVFTFQNALDNDPEDPSPIEAAAVCIRVCAPSFGPPGSPPLAPTFTMIANPSDLLKGIIYQMQIGRAHV